MISKVSFINRAITGMEFDVVVKECGRLLENGFKEIYHQAITSLPFEARNAVSQAETDIGKGNKGAVDFIFGKASL